MRDDAGCQVGVEMVLPPCAPEISVQESVLGHLQEDVNVVYGDTPIHDPVYRQYIITNQGTANLVLGSPTLTGADFAFSASFPFPTGEFTVCKKRAQHYNVVYMITHDIQEVIRVWSDTSTVYMDENLKPLT